MLTHNTDPHTWSPTLMQGSIVFDAESREDIHVLAELATLLAAVLDDTSPATARSCHHGMLN